MLFQPPSEHTLPRLAVRVIALVCNASGCARLLQHGEALEMHMKVLAVAAAMRTIHVISTHQQSKTALVLLQPTLMLLAVHPGTELPALHEA